MKDGEVMAELDRAISTTKRALNNGVMPEDTYALGVLDALTGFRRFVRSQQFAAALHKQKATTKETPTNAH